MDVSSTGVMLMGHSNKNTHLYTVNSEFNQLFSKGTFETIITFQRAGSNHIYAIRICACAFVWGVCMCELVHAVTNLLLCSGHTHNLHFLGVIWSCAAKQQKLWVMHMHFLHVNHFSFRASSIQENIAAAGRGRGKPLKKKQLQLISATANTHKLFWAVNT